MRRLKEVLEVPSNQEWECTTRLLLRLMGEDPHREGLKRTPLRMKRSLQFLTSGYRQDPSTILKRAFANVKHDEMVIVKDIDFYSLCIHGKSIVYTPHGYCFAASVRPGDRLLTVDPATKTLTETEVLATSVSKHRERFRIRFSNGRSLILTGDHPVYVRDKGFVPAGELRKGELVLGVHSQSLDRPVYTPRLNYTLGYVLGTIASDGSSDSGRRLRLEVNELAFAKKFAEQMEDAFGIEAHVEPIRKPSGFLGREIPQDRVQVCSSFIREVVRGFLGGDTHSHVDHIGNGTSRVYVSKRWFQPRNPAKGFKHGFEPRPQAAHLQRVLADVMTRVYRVESIIRECATLKSYTMYNFECSPHHSFLANGVLVKNCEHHLLPFFGKCHIAYVPGDKLIGLSKIPRLVDAFAHRLQVQERLTTQIAGALNDQVRPLGVACVIEASHLCLMMRGVQKQNARAVTSSMLGVFRSSDKTRAEFLTLIRSSLAS
jgi:GTP cyclohydrolase I